MRVPVHRLCMAWLCLAFVLSSGGRALAQDAPPSLSIPKVSSPPRIDDYLDGESHPGLAVTDFRQRHPLDLAPASESTTAWLSYDGDHLYAVFVCRASNPSAVRARMARREQAGADDQVGLYLDTFLDRQRSYVFTSNPLGVQTDGIQSEGGGEDHSFDAQWRSEGRTTSFGYVVLFEIPFKSLRFPPGAGAQRWGIALHRSIPANSEASYFPPISDNVSGFTTQFAFLDGIQGVQPGRNIQLIPYGTFTSARLLQEDTGAYLVDHDPRAGVDAKFVVRDAVTVDLTANPDFSQVESDEPQVVVNQRFEVFFPEKRPFFLENADLFETPWSLFFSRRIRDPQVGSRVTGKAGQWAFGGLVMDDRAPGRQQPEDSEFHGDRAINAIGRARFDFAGGSRLGVMGTSRRFGDRANEVVAADGRWRATDRWVLSGQVVASRTAAASQADDGAATSFNLNRSGRGFELSAFYNSVSPDFRTDLGFIPRTDLHEAGSFMALRWRPTSGPVVAYGPNLFPHAVFDYGGDLQDWRVNMPFAVDLKGRTNLFVRRAEMSEKVSGIDLRQHENLFSFGSEYFAAFNFFAHYSFGTRPNYSPAGGLAPYVGSFDDVFLGFGIRPTAALLFDETYIYTRLASRQGSPGEGTIFSNHLLRSKVNYQFSRAWSLRAIVDYQLLDANPELIDLTNSRRVVTDFLVTWLRNPGTAIYLGYTDGYDNVAIDPSRGVVRTDGSLTSTGRQVFVKIGWLFAF